MRYFILTVVAILIGGCANRLPPMNTYTIHVTGFGKTDKIKYRGKTLKIAYTESIKERVSYKMKYSYSPAEQGVYQNSQWSNDIGRLLQSVYIDTFEKSGTFRAVLPYTSSLNEDYRLESCIFDFSHHVRGERSYAVVSIQFNLVDMNTGRLVKSRRFDYQEPTVTTDAKGYADATNRIIKKLCRDLLHWI